MTHKNEKDGQICIVNFDNGAAGFEVKSVRRDVLRRMRAEPGVPWTIGELAQRVKQVCFRPVDSSAPSA